MRFAEKTPTTKRRRIKGVTFIVNEDSTLDEEQKLILTAPPTADEHQILQLDPYVHPNSSIVRRGEDTGPGEMNGRGEYGGRGTNNIQKLVLKDPVPLLLSLMNEVDNLMIEIRLDIMCEIKLVITSAIISQILELAIAMVKQIKAAITVDVSAEVTKKLNLSPGVVDKDLEPITQSPTVTNDTFQATSMKVDTNPRKRENTQNQKKHYQQSL